MKNIEELKGQIVSALSSNGEGEITGETLRQTLLDVVDALDENKQEVIEDLDQIREDSKKGGEPYDDSELTGKVTELELKVDDLEKRPVVDKDLTERVADLENTHKYDHNLAKTRIKELSVDEPIKVCNAPAVLIGAGAPSASVIPQNWDKATMGEWFGIPNFIGQMYVNISASSNALYVAVNDTATNGWKTA